MKKKISRVTNGWFMSIRIKPVPVRVNITERSYFERDWGFITLRLAYAPTKSANSKKCKFKQWNIPDSEFPKFIKDIKRVLTSKSSKIITIGNIIAPRPFMKLLLKAAKEVSTKKLGIKIGRQKCGRL